MPSNPMAACLLVVLFSTLSIPASASTSASDHPIVGVITLLQRLQVQAREEGAAEAQLFQKFTYWCKSSEKTLNKAIKKQKTTIASLDDQIDGLKADILSLDEEIKLMGDQLAEMNAAVAKAKKIREDEHALYMSEQDNFDDTVEAVHDATEVMKDSKDVALSQKGERVVKKAMFLAERLDAKRGKQEPKTHDFHSGGIIETFKGMEVGFEEEKLDATQQETNKQNAYNLAKRAREHAIKSAEDSKAEKESIKSDKEAVLADATTAKSQEETSLAADTKSLEDTQVDCKAKSAEWTQRSSIREDEIKAMEQAMKILSKISGVRNPEEHEIPTKSLMEATSAVDQDTATFQQAIAVSFLQAEDPKAKAVTLLKKAATRTHSKALQKLAQEIATYKGPFDQIKQMIQKMVFRLMAEQKDEDDQKNWCDIESEKSSESKTAKKEKMDLYADKIAEMDSKIKELVTKVAENDEKVKLINEYTTEETDLRNENHAEIKATIKDAQSAQAAITQAITVLRQFYKESGMIAKEPWEFVQLARDSRGVKLPDSPDTWDSSYSGVADPKAGGEGVLAILEGTMTKFSEMEADAKVSDERDQKNFDADMAAKKVELEEIKMDSQMKTTKKDSLQEKLEAMKAQLKHTTSEYTAVKQYLKDLEPACGAGDSSFEDRKAARADEVEALKKAQGILEDAFRAK